MTKMASFLFSALILYALTACGTAPAPPTTTPTEMPTETTTIIPSPTGTNKPTNTPELFKLSFQAFNDYNGNGKMDEGELPLEGILTRASTGECITGTDGTCKIKGVPKGDNTISFTDSRNVSLEEKMRYILPSESEIRTIEDGLSVRVDGSGKVALVPLGQGLFTLPFSAKTIYSVSNYYDLDLSSCPVGSEPHTCANIRDWRGGKTTYDNHTGIDFLATLGTPILAVAPGNVIHVGSDSASGNYVIIQIDPTYVVHYNHLNTISLTENTFVDRGQEIGTVGSTGNSSTPHLHLELQKDGTPIDFYKDLNSLSSLNYWTKLNTPVSPQ